MNNGFNAINSFFNCSADDVVAVCKAVQQGVYFGIDSFLKSFI
jgi:hypothetical protein